MVKNAGQIGENIFEELCEFHSWSCQKIPEFKNRTPDYNVETQRGSFISEVSVIDPGPVEDGVVRTIKIGKAVRNKIKKKKGQFDNPKLPTLLVLTGDPVQLGYESITAAMYGDLTININVITGKTSETYYGKNAKMRENNNTVFSAIAFMNRAFKEYKYKGKKQYEPSLVVYHNMFANMPFTEDFFSNYNNIKQVFYEQ